MGHPYLAIKSGMAASRDARGSTIQQFKEKPVRIVSLVPSQTELLYHLGLDEEMAGITKFCVHPEAWFRTKTRVGGTKNLDIAGIKELHPDLIIANKEENEKAQVEELAQAFPVWVTDVCNLYDALAMIEAIGALTGKAAAATSLLAHIATTFTQLRELKIKKTFRTCYLIWKDPYLTVGGDTFIHDMLQQAGFENMFARQHRYPELTLETLQTMHCELLLLSSEPYPFAKKHIAYFQALLPETKILLADGELFSWYGSRLQWAPAYFRSLHEQLDNIAL
jgi:ABC-type Fe3+-hydroxamate transport system substrate-binding protein